MSTPNRAPAASALRRRAAVRSDEPGRGDGDAPRELRGTGARESRRGKRAAADIAVTDEQDRSGSEAPDLELRRVSPARVQNGIRKMARVVDPFRAEAPGNSSGCLVGSTCQTADFYCRRAHLPGYQPSLQSSMMGMVRAIIARSRTTLRVLR